MLYEERLEREKAKGFIDLLVLGWHSPEDYRKIGQKESNSFDNKDFDAELAEKLKIQVK